MKSETSSKQFIFSEKLDTESLYSLYEDDYAGIEDIFTTTLLHYDADLDAVVAAYNKSNIGELKRAVHKIKPVFGFTGLPKVQESCQAFEDACTGSAFTDITEKYIHIKNLLLEAKSTIASEQERLRAFNLNL